jgi:hypothetical protein
MAAMTNAATASMTLGAVAAAINARRHIKRPRTVAAA